MHGLFFITGLPRARSAWMANLLTAGNCFCHHDLWCQADDDLEKLKPLLWATGTPWVGVSDPMNAMHWQNLIATYPEARWLILERDVDDVRASWRKLGWDEAGISIWQEHLAQLRQTASTSHTLHLDTASDEEIFEACQYLVPSFWNWPNFQRRLKLLRTLNVQVHDLPAKIEAAMAQRREEEIAA